MRAAAPAIGLLLIFAISASAQDQPEVDCQKAETQMDLNICADQEYQAADTELNKVYRKAVDAMQKTDKELGDLDAAYVGAVDALKKAQRSWIGYRDGQCELAGFEARGGSMEPMLVSGCLADLTRKRTAELKELLEAQGN
ncbi:lysozyme inhibitor LprI family protein [Ensifer sp. BR816]|uniref:lysozyme inhibitor LprI family protein n=1 Tax=Rhizobium sp. (strain BR816) TaxID=1057002 RepID=UPI0003715A04|nr:lysozyme inhibitor LprI family protein [Ensifer sp. BR816]